MKKNLLLLLVPALLLVGCGKKDEGETNNQTQSQTEESGSQETGGQEIHQDPVTKTSTLVTFGDSYEAEFTNGLQFGSDHAGNVTKLTDFLNGQALDSNLVRSLDCVSLNSLDDLEKDGSGNRYLTFGSKSASGSLTMQFSYPVSKIEILCINYHNTYAGGGGGYNCDVNSHLKIGDNDLSLEIVDKTKPVEKTLSVDYSTAVSSIKVESAGGRVFVKSISITYTA